MIGQKLANLCNQIHPPDGKHLVTVEATEVGKRNLAFNHTVELIWAVGSGWDPAVLFRCYLRDDGNRFRLDGTSPSNHEVSAKALVRIME